jgi:hypothetical protein
MASRHRHPGTGRDAPFCGSLRSRLFRRSCRQFKLSCGGGLGPGLRRDDASAGIKILIWEAKQCAKRGG